jgi:DNA mismatch repair protein MutS2
MKEIAQTVGLFKLKEEISKYADSKPGKLLTLSLNPVEPDGNIRKIFKNLSQVVEYQGLIPNLSILEKWKEPGLGVVFNSEELLYIARVLDLTNEVKKIFDENRIMEDLIIDLVSLPEINEEIKRCIDDDGQIKVDASTTLKSLYVERKKLKSKIDNKLQNIIQNYRGLLQDEVITQRSDRTVIPVKYDRKGEIEGVVIDLSRTGNTAFIEPAEIVPLNNQYREISIDMEEEKKKILKELTDKVRGNSKFIEKNIDILAEIDSLKARAIYAKKFDCRIPEFSKESILTLKKCRHPLLMIERDVVPLDLELGQDYRILLVSGPNAGGKTILLKTIGIIVLSAYSGLPIPADSGTKIGTFKNIFGIIEDEQSLEENLSTFSSYVIRLAKILNDADKNSLVLCDELGGNTDPEEGGALAISILNSLLERGSIVIATTHLGTLKFYVADNESMQNGAMEYVDGPTYHLQIGIPGGSRTIATAKRFGLQKEIIESAKKYLNLSVLKAEDLIEELSMRSKKLREHEEKISELKMNLENLINEYNEKMKNVKKEQKKILSDAKEKSKEILKDARSTIEKTIKEIKESKASKESILDYKDTFNNIFKEDKKEKETITQPKKEKMTIKYNIDTEVPLEISVRGLNREEAWQKTDKYLDRAALANYEQIRIVHGKGSWILRNALHEKLKKDPRVKSISTPGENEGGSGVTLIKLK